MGAPKGSRWAHQSRSAMASNRCWRVVSSVSMASASSAVGLPSCSHANSSKLVRSSKAVAIVPSIIGGFLCLLCNPSMGGASLASPVADHQPVFTRLPDQLAATAYSTVKRSVSHTLALARSAAQRARLI